MRELIYKDVARRIIDSPRSKEQMLAVLESLPSAQPDWNEMIVMCDCCGHAIHVKRIDAERQEE